jgi:hypothetical protein
MGKSVKKKTLLKTTTCYNLTIICLRVGAWNEFWIIGKVVKRRKGINELNIFKVDRYE